VSGLRRNEPCNPVQLYCRLQQRQPGPGRDCLLCLALHTFSCYPSHVSMERYIVWCVFLCPVTDISATVAPIGVKFCIMVYISVPDRYFPFWGRYPRPRDPKSEIFGLNFGHLTANISETVSRSVTCQHQLDDCFLGMLSQRAVPPPGGECTPVCRVCVLLTHLLSIIVSPRLLSMSVRPSVPSLCLDNSARLLLAIDTVDFVATFRSSPDATVDRARRGDGP